MIKRTLNLIIILALYEMIKYFIGQTIIVLTANDDIDSFDEYDHVHSNDLFGREGDK